MFMYWIIFFWNKKIYIWLLVIFIFCFIGVVGVIWIIFISEVFRGCCCWILILWSVVVTVFIVVFWLVLFWIRFVKEVVVFDCLGKRIVLIFCVVVDSWIGFIICWVLVFAFVFCRIWLIFWFCGCCGFKFWFWDCRLVFVILFLIIFNRFFFDILVWLIWFKFWGFVVLVDVLVVFNCEINWVMICVEEGFLIMVGVWVRIRVVEGLLMIVGVCGDCVVWIVWWFVVDVIIVCKLVLLVNCW